MLRFRDHLRANAPTGSCTCGRSASWRRRRGSSSRTTPTQEPRWSKRSCDARREPARERDQPLPPPARRQPGRVVPVGEEALARARDEDRPMLLSIGYSACHWCHVMEHESFEDEGDGAADERALRQRQGRPRGAARPRRGLHGRGRRPDRARRLADDRVPHPGGRALLRRHVLPARAAPRAAELPPGAERGRATPTASGAREVDRSARPAGRRTSARRASCRRRASRSPSRCCARRVAGPARAVRPALGRLRPRAEVPARVGARVPAARAASARW